MTIIYLSFPCLTRESRDPRVKPEGDKEEKKVSEGDCSKKEPEGDWGKKAPEDDKEERRPIKREPRGRKMTSLKTFPNKKYTPETVEIFLY